MTEQEAIKRAMDIFSDYRCPFPGYGDCTGCTFIIRPRKVYKLIREIYESKEFEKLKCKHLELEKCGTFYRCKECKYAHR